jgi:hypothetical protein
MGMVTLDDLGNGGFEVGNGSILWAFVVSHEFDECLIVIRVGKGIRVGQVTENNSMIAHTIHQHNKPDEGLLGWT